MRIVFSADLHLTDKKDSRYDNLLSILKLLILNKLTDLVIAGDLFDDGVVGYKLFDALALEFSEINFYIIPGNHDSTVSQNLFSAKNIRLFSEIEIYEFPQVKLKFLFIPFYDEKFVAQVIEESNKFKELNGSDFVLVTHGDFGKRNRSDNGEELGYFPLTSQELDRYQPKLVIMGHIHKPSIPANRVYYTGSPYPLNINETGQRRLLLLDTNQPSELKNIWLNFNPLYLQHEILLIPGENEKGYLEETVDKFLSTNETKYQGNNFYEKLTLRLKIRGYSSSRNLVVGYLLSYLKSKKVEVDSINIDDLEQADDSLLNTIAIKVTKKIRSENLYADKSDEFKNSIIVQALQSIYGVEKG